MINASSGARYISSSLSLRQHALGETPVTYFALLLIALALGLIVRNFSLMRRRFVELVSLFLYGRAGARAASVQILAITLPAL